MKRPESPCLDCEVRMERCHEFCGLYNQYVELQAEYRKLIKQKRWESYGTRVEWTDSRLKMNRRDK